MVDWFGGPAYFGFPLLKAYSVGFAIQDVTLRHARLNVSFVFTAPLLGTLSDRIGRQIESSLNGAVRYVLRSHPGYFQSVPKIAAASATEYLSQVKALTKKVVHILSAVQWNALPAPTGVTPAPPTQQKQH